MGELPPAHKHGPVHECVCGFKGSPAAYKRHIAQPLIIQAPHSIVLAHGGEQLRMLTVPELIRYGEDLKERWAKDPTMETRQLIAELDQESLRRILGA